MANQNNFKTNVTTQNFTYQKYTVSRIVNTLNDDLVRMEMPADFYYTDMTKVMVEFSLYSIYNNRLVYSGIAQNSETATPIFVQNLYYNDDTLRTLLCIDFQQIPNILFPEGTYQLVTNIFVNEVGTLDDSILKITKISPSRKEVELLISPLNETNVNTVKNYIDTSVNPIYILPLVKEIYGKLEQDTYIPANRTKMTSESVFNAIPSSSRLEDYGFDIDSVDGKYGVKTLIGRLLDTAYTRTEATISLALANRSSSFSYAQILGYVTTSIVSAYEDLMDDNNQNSAKYRFDLI